MKFNFIFNALRRSVVSWGYNIICVMISFVRNYFGKEIKLPKHALIIQLAHLGDAVLTTPIISALGKKYPGINIDLLTRSQNLPVFECNKFVTSVYKYDSEKYHRTGTGSVTKFDFNTLSTSNYDVVIYLKGDLRTLRYLAFGCYGKVALCKSIGYPLRLTWLRMLGIRFPEKRCLHYVESMFVALSKIGMQLSDYASESSCVSVGNDAVDRVSSVISSVVKGKKYVVLHCSTPFPYRNWPKERFAQLARHVVDKWNYHCLLVGDDASYSVCEEIRKATGSKLVDNVAGKFGLLETLALIADAVVYVGNDSGPLHMAGATDTPCLAFYGPQLPDLFGPWQTRGRVLFKRRDCCPCWQSGCLSPSCHCLADITVQEAANAFDGIIAEIRIDKSFDKLL